MMSKMQNYIPCILKCNGTSRRKHDSTFYIHYALVQLYESETKLSDHAAEQRNTMRTANDVTFCTHEILLELLMFVLVARKTSLVLLFVVARQPSDLQIDLLKLKETSTIASIFSTFS